MYYSLIINLKQGAEMEQEKLEKMIREWMHEEYHARNKDGVCIDCARIKASEETKEIMLKNGFYSRETYWKIYKDRYKSIKTIKEENVMEPKEYV